MKQTKSQLIKFDLEQAAPILAEYLSGKGISTLDYCPETKEYWRLQVWKQYYCQLLETKNDEFTRIQSSLDYPKDLPLEIFANPDGSPYKVGPSEDGRFGVFVFVQKSVEPSKQLAEIRGEIKILHKTIKAIESRINSEHMRIRYGSR